VVKAHQSNELYRHDKMFNYQEDNWVEIFPNKHPNVLVFAYDPSQPESIKIWDELVNV